MQIQNASFTKKGFIKVVFAGGLVRFVDAIENAIDEMDPDPDQADLAKACPHYSSS